MIQATPVPLIEAKPSERNILEWHYVLTGPSGTPYDGGQYHGVILFPKEYPFKPPSIRMDTPNGRFKPKARICLSISDFHPESWNPAWHVSTIIQGLQSIMVERDRVQGGVNCTQAAKRKYARDSRSYNANENELFKYHFHELAQLELEKGIDGLKIDDGGS